MAKYKVKVKVIATLEFECEVEVSGNFDWDKAEDLACGRESLNKHLPEDFQVEKGYMSFETESEAVAWICPDCDEEHDKAGAWEEDEIYCKHCGKKIVEAELAERAVR